MGGSAKYIVNNTAANKVHPSKFASEKRSSAVCRLRSEDIILLC